MTMHSWLDKLVNRTRNHPITRRSTKLKSRTRLTIEGLEDRWVPATYTVLNTNDTGAGSLRDAIAQANANIGADTIVFGDGSGSGGTNFLDGTADTITLTSGDITFAGDTALTTVTGPGANLLTISGGNTQRVFWVNSGIATSISGMTLTGGRANGTPGTNSSAGAAVYNAGTLDLTNVTVSGNSSTGTGGSGKGGAVHSQGNLTLTNSIVTGNTGNGVNTGNGSGILAIINSTISNNTLSGLQVGGGQARLIGTTISGNTRQGVNAYLTDLMMANCTVSGNSNSGDGAGVLIGLGSAALTNCTITGNNATGNGGGILLRGTVTLTNCTISGNSAAIGGGVDVFSGTPTFVNTIVAGNTASNRGPDVGGTSSNPQAISSLGNNLIGKTDGSSGWSGSDLMGTIAAPLNPQRGTLASNGGTTQTLALLSGSPAINAGNGSLAPSEVQDIAIYAPGGGTFSVTFNGQTTGQIAYNAGAATLQTVLNALSSIGGVGGSVTVTKSGNVFRVTFGGTLANQNLPQMTTSGAGGTTATVLTLVDGNTDQRGLARAGNTDIGAFETQFKVYSTADSGNGSLRQAIANANSSAGVDNIVFSSLFNSPQTITLTSGVITLTDAATTTITGTAAGVTVSGNNASGVFKVNNGASAALSRLTITGGNTYQGGGLWNDFGTVTITDSAVVNNTASFGGGLDNVGGTMVLTNVTLSGNTASNNGGAIDNVGATLTLINTTISGNNAGEGGGLRNNGTANISNTIIAGNTAPSSPDVWNTVNSQGNNLIGKTDGSSGWVGSDLTGTIASPLNPQLGALANNGGPTQTMALLSGSSAINAGNPANAPATDQRGSTRGGNTDIGAYETQFKVYSTADSGNGSLRQAIANANSSPGADDIVFSSLFNTAQTITLTSGQITFTDTATTTVLNSPGGVTVSGNNAGRVFFINTGASASIISMTITGGLIGASGGAIANAGDLSLNRTTVSGNISGDDSGAIANFGGATLNITNSTFANNSTANDGGAIRNSGTLNITNSTFSGNHSGIAGGGIRNEGTMTIANSIIAGNSANQVGPDIYGTVTSSGNNLIGKTDNSSGWVGTDLTGTIASPLNAQLGSLADNGGPARTMALLPNSPAINAGDASRAPVTDQRGQTRFGNTDIGAFEYQFKVTNTTDSGNGSLRGAINNSNAVNTLDTIIFKIPGSGVQTITPFSALPTIVDPVIIDGTSATGYAGLPLIEIAGTNAGGGTNGLTITSSGSTISGLAINRFSGSGLVITGASATGNVIKGNYLGIGTDGATDLGNTLDGITITAGAANNTIGGIGTNDRNIISGNASDGIEISGSGSDSNVIIGNFIGLNAAGTSPIRNDGNGVLINAGPQFNRIGTNGDGLNDGSERNVISGNSSTTGAANINIISANYNRVSGNYIGTNAAGTATVLNGGRGIRLATGSSFNIIGTDGSNDAFNANERNIVSGSNNAGIFLAGSANDNTIAGNWVGLNASGTASLGNGGDGISISGSKRNLVGSNADGIADAAEANVVVGSGNFGGVLIADPGNQDNIIAGNFIGTNPTGTALLGTQQYGVTIGDDAHDNRIGGVNTAERNIISGSSKHGIYVVKYQTFPTGYNTTIQGNYIGTDVSGTIDFGNANDGVMLENSYGNIVGGTAAGAGNLISGNNLRGIEITGSLSTGNSVLGNRIGTDVNGTSALPNSTFGVLISAGATGNTIGGSLSGSRNIISGNNSTGVIITGAGTNSNTIAGNYIGLNASGNAAVPNLAGGVRIRLGAQFNLIGTNADGINDANERNVISGNINHDGVAISNPGTNFNIVSGNYLGTDPTGTFSIGNSDSGVSIFSGAQFNRVGTNGLKGSVLNAVEGNLISGNGLDGVYLENANNNTFAGNIIGLNSSGSAILRNGATGMLILAGASGNTIGTNSDGLGDAEERNVISGNLTHGIQISDPTTSSNVIAGNFIGTDTNGTLGLGNLLDGVHIDTGAKNNTIGGATSSSGNLISGNTGDGVRIVDAGTSGNLVAGNLIGTDYNGSAALGNQGNGITVGNAASSNTIGGVTGLARNVISGQTNYSNGGLGGWGVVIAGDSNVINGNYIGTDKSGLNPLGNSDGIYLSSGANITVGGLTSTAGTGAGNVISGNGDIGILVGNATKATIQGNLIGTDKNGTVAMSNGIPNINESEGIYLQGGTGTIIGGSVPTARNIITSNGTGIRIQGSSSNTIIGNYIGLDITGTTTLGSSHTTGILIQSGDNNLIGAVTATAGTGPGNVIATGEVGVNIQAGVSGTFVQGNLIGTNAAGTSGLGSMYLGVGVGGSGNTVGGSVAGSGNLISHINFDNNSVAVSMSGSSNLLAGNRIGTDITGSTTIPNSIGVSVTGTNNTVGGLVASAGNLIRGNAVTGIQFSATGGSVQNNTVAYNGGPGIQLSSGRALVTQNSFIGNNGLGIDVGPAGPTPNDSGDLDNVLNAPVLTLAHLHGTLLEISGFARPGSTIEFYIAGPDPTQFGEGTTYLGTVTEGSGTDTDTTAGTYNSPLRGLNVGSDSTSRFTFLLSVPDSVTQDSVITALTIDPTGSTKSGTSEFSANITPTPGVVFGAPLVSAGANATILEGGTFAASGTFTDLDSTKWTATVDYGDGSGVQPLNLNPINYQPNGDGYTPSATGTFDLAHVYSKAGTYSVNVKVIDDSGNPGNGFSTVVVNSAPAQIDDSNINVSPAVINEGGSVTVTGRFTDPSSVDHHSVMITWGDGTVTPADSIDEVNRTFTATHVYSDDKPKGTESDVYSLQVAISDSSSAVAKTTYGLFYVQVNNVRPSNLTLTPLTSTINENGFVTLGGVFSDPGILDQHLVTINWGDGSLPDVIPLGAGILSFSGITHQYLNNPSLPANSFGVQVSVTDDDEPLRPTLATSSIVVRDVPSSNLQIFASPTTSKEGAITSIAGTFVDPGTNDRHKVVVNWGDGSAASETVLPAGVTAFSGFTHTYLDNPAGQPNGAYTIQVNVTDVNEPTGAPLIDYKTQTVLNVAPTLGQFGLTRSNGTPLDPSNLNGAIGQINENDEISFTGSFADPGRLDSQIVTIDWGDGSPLTTATISKATSTFQASHRFVDNAVGTLVSLDSIRVTITDNDGGSTSDSLGLAIANVAPQVRILSGGGTAAGVTLKAVASDAGPIDASGLTYLWTVSGYGWTGTGSSFTLPNPTAFLSYQVTLTVTDNDGVSTSTTTAVIALDDNPNIFQIPAQPAGVSSVAVFGLGGDDIISAGTILTDGFNRIIFDADGAPLTSGVLNIPVILDGGSGKDTLIGGSADDTIYLQQGNDTAYGQQGNDKYLLKPNSTLTVVDGSGSNTLDFGLADFGSNVGVTFNLQQTSGQVQDVAPIGTLAGHHFVSANDLGTGTFSTLIGSSFDDNLTAASGATLFGGAGADTFNAVSTSVSTLSNAIFNGGADGDFLITSGPNIGNLTFNGDDGADILQNLGVITGSLIFNGGADADVINNSPTGVILGSPTFNGDDGVFTVTNQGVIQGTPTFNGGADGDVLLTNFGTITGSPTFNGGADGEVLVNQPGGVITGTPTFNGDDGVIFVTNNGTINGTPTFNGGADADSFINGPGGVITGTLVFNGDDGANTITNFGVILGTPTFTGGADADVFTNAQGGVISGSPTFTGGADADSFINAPGAVISGNPVFNGDSGADLITNYGSITGTPTFVGGADGDVFTNAPGAVISGAMTFNGDDGANSIVNFGAITGSATFIGGADADVFTNAPGAVISGTPIFTGGADADSFVNSVNATISGSLTFNGDDGADTIVNSGTIGNALGLGSLTFNGGADGDSILNPGIILGNLTFNGDDGADMFYNGATVGGTPISGSINTLTFNGDSGADLFINPIGGTIGTLTFGGGADGDVLNNQGVILGNLTFNGDDGANFLTNNGSIGGSATFVGGADADTFVNTGPIGTLTFNGDLGDDRLYNSQNSIGLVSFNAGPGNDLFINDGSGINTVSFKGGTGNDVFGNTGSNLGAVTFLGDDGADTFVNTGSTTGGFTTSLTFNGGADQDTLINKGSATGTGNLGVLFTGDDGADTFVNQGSNLSSLIFVGGADNDGFLNTGTNVASIKFTGDDGADVLRNDGLNLGILTFSGGADGDVLANYGTIVGALSFNGDDGADSLRNSGTISGTLSFNGDDGSDRLINTLGGVISGTATFNGGADADSFVNSQGGAILGVMTFNGDEGADLLGNAGVIPGSLTFNGGADADSIVNVGVIGGSLTFGGDDGADAFYNGGYVNGVFIGGSINTLTFNGDDGADVLANPAGGTIATLSFVGGADGDVLSNLGVVTGALSFEGDTGADVFVNQTGGVISGPLTYNGGADADSLYNQPGAVIGGLTFNGDDGADSLVNAGAIVGALTYSGGADADTFTNTAGGVISGPLTFNGDDGADQITNQVGAIIGNLTFNGGADGDFLANQGTISGNLTFNGDDGANTLTQGGVVSGSLIFTGGADADTLTTQQGSTIGGSLTFNGDDGANTLIVSGAIAGSLMFSGGSDSDVLIFGPTGSARSVEAHTGADKDQFIIAGGGGASFLLDGGSGDDTYTFAGLPSANITIGESYTGTADTSSDTLDFSAYTGGSLVLDLALTTPQILINNRLTLTLTDPNGMENVIGTPQADTIYGNDRPNLLTGAALADDRLIAPSATPPQGLQAISRTQWVLLDFDTYSETGEHVYTQEERAAIQARIESVYHGPDPLNPWFDVKFARDKAGIPSELLKAGQFATLFFNKTPSFNRPGGEASEVDFGNTNLDGYASIQVNGLVGGEGQPADTSDNFVRLSGKIAAHELAHLLGVRHSDSFGPIGLGLHSPPGTEKFGPDYPGPAAAYETFDHIISSPATVGSDRFNDLRDLYFGPREAIKLTFDQKGVTLPEPAATHNTIATAAPINLYALTVPNTATTGLDAGKSFQVGAVNVTGNLKIDPSTGRAESDYYALSGNKGDIVTMEVDSTLLARLNGKDTIDSVLSVYDAQGNLVPYYGGKAQNDDQFEPTDSLILDLVLPATGTYYVQVASFSRNPADPIFDPTNPASPLNPSNVASTLNPLNPSFSQDRLNSFLATRDGTDTGAYGLFIYRFSGANPTDQGDYLNGRAGNDTLKGGLGNDTLIGGAGQDDIESGEGGSGYVLGVTPRDTSFDLSLINPGLQTTLAISDPSGSAFWDVTVDYGDGSIVHYNNVQAVSPVSIGHTYSTPGNYTALISVQNDDGLVGTSSLTVKVSAQKASTFVVAPSGTGTYGGTATITASLGADGTALAGKTVAFTFNNGIVVTALGTATTDSNGVATLNGVDLTRIGAGTYVGYVGANFAGDTLYQGTSSSGNLVIAKASLTVTADAKSKVYGGADPALTYTPSGTLFYGDAYSVISAVSLSTKTGAQATAGLQPIIVSGGTAANYNITTVNGTLTVSKASLTVTADPKTKVYGGADPALTYTPSGNLFYGDAYSVISGVSLSTKTGALATAGLQPIIVSGGTAANYNITTVNGTLTISKASLTVTADPKTKVYGGADPALTYTPSGNLFYGDAYSVISGVSLSTKTGALATAGLQPIIVSGGTAVNYNITTVNGTLTVSKASLTVTADPKTKVYGGADPALTYTPSGNLFYGDAYSVISGVSLSTKTGAQATAGTQPIIISGGAAANYDINTVNGILTVSQKALTITASSRSKNFGSTVTFAGTEFSASGLVYSDSVSGISLSSTGAAASAPVGTYSITPSAATGSGLGNYSISYSAGSLTVITRAGSVFVLNPTANGALSLSGNASLNTIGDLVVDSSSTSAITASGNASAIASALLNMGGISITGNAKVSTPQGRPGSSADPYASLAVPTSSGSVLSVSVTGNSVQTINPGTYSSIKVSGNGKLTLNPGTYIIAGGGLSVSGNGSISGNGVTIYNGGSNIVSTGPASFGGVGLSGNGAVQLSAPTSGVYAGILIFQSRDNTLAISLSGNSALGISGMIYAPKALLSISGNAQLQSHIPIVVDQLQISGNGSSSLNTEGTGTTAGQLLSGDRALFIDDQSGYLNGNARDRINDAINQLDQLLQPFSITVSLTTDRATADLVLNTGTTSPVGGLAQGVLGCYSETGEITLIQGWNWYTGSDPAGIGANQFDFSTIVVHELGHALGLGHSASPASTMFAGLGTGQTRRLLTTADLCIPETEDGNGGHDGLHAVLPENGALPPVQNEIQATVPSDHSPALSNGTMVSILDRVFTNSSLSESQVGSIGAFLNMGSPLTPKFGNRITNRSNKAVGTFGQISAVPLVGKTFSQLKLKQNLADSIALEMATSEIQGMGSDAVATGGSQNEDVMINEMRVPNHV